MENRKTAVEWLVEELAIKTGSSFHAITFYHDNNELINQAKSMEKEQIKNALKVGISIGFDDNDEYMSEKYFNINYGK